MAKNFPEIKVDLSSVSYRSSILTEWKNASQYAIFQKKTLQICVLKARRWKVLAIVKSFFQHCKVNIYQALSKEDNTGKNTFWSTKEKK